MFNVPTAIADAFVKLLRHPQRWAVPSLLLGSMALGAQDRQMDAFYGPTGPYPAYREPKPEDYNVKWGALRGRLGGSLQVEYNDNVFLFKDGAKSDFSFHPNLTLGFFWPISRDQTLQLDLGVGYLWYATYDELSYFYLAPDSRLDYRISLPDANLQFLFHEGIGTSVDPTSRPEISGTTTNGARGFVFRRLSNTVGMDVQWLPARPWKVTGGYSFTLDRSLSGDFPEQDLDTHTLSLGADYGVSSAWSIGLFGSYTMNNYVEKVLNDSDAYTIGPRFVFTPMRSLSVFGSAGYSVYQYDSTGSVADTSDFSGVTFQAGIRQTLSRALSHNFQVSRRVESGWVSNYTDLWEAQYGFDAILMRDISVSALLTYQNFAVSGSSLEKGDRYLARLSTGYQFARRWNAGLAYYFALKDAKETALDYTQDRVALTITHQF